MASNPWNISLRGLSPIDISRIKPISEKQSQVFREEAAKIEALHAEMNAYAASHDQGTEPVYGLLYKDGAVVGYLFKNGGMAYINPSIVDGVAVAQATRSPKEAADWIEANVEGLTVKRFSGDTKAPTVREANGLMNQTAAVQMKAINPNWTPPDLAARDPHEVAAERQRSAEAAAPIYGLIEKDGTIVGAIYGNGGVSAPEGFDTKRLLSETQYFESNSSASPTELAALRAAWFEAQGATVQRYGTGQKAPTRAQAETMIGQNTTAARWQQNLNWFKADHSA